jgi:hypothetical protein
MERPSGRRRPALRRCFLSLLLLLPFAGPARGLTLADIEPLYFDGPSGQGFSASAVAAAGRSATFSATPLDLGITSGIGSGFQISITQVLGVPYQNPASPSSSNPLIVDSTWTLRNDTSITLLDPLLILTRVDPLNLYPIAPPKTGLDADTLSLLRYSFANESRLYGAIALPTLRPGDTADVTVRYVVAGALAPGTPMKLPPLGSTVLGSYAVIPEPATAALLCVGLIALASSARARGKRG